jgi:hypothetical protein
MNNGFVDTLVQNTNIGIVFASGPFPLPNGAASAFVALVNGLDLDALIFNKVTVQNIYNANYNFSKPYTLNLAAIAVTGRSSCTGMTGRKIARSIPRQ